MSSVEETQTSKSDSESRISTNGVGGGNNLHSDVGPCEAVKCQQFLMLIDHFAYGVVGDSVLGEALFLHLLLLPLSRVTPFVIEASKSG